MKRELSAMGPELIESPQESKKVEFYFGSSGGKEVSPIETLLANVVGIEVVYNWASLFKNTQKSAPHDHKTEEQATSNLRLE